MVLTDTGLAKVFQRIKSFIIAQLNSKASAIHTHTVSDISDLSTNYVTTDTTQTIDGTKKFTKTVTIEKSGGDTELLVKNTAVDVSSITTNAMDDIRFVDQNDNITGGLRLTYETNGSISTTMYARSYSQDGLTYANKVFTITSNIQTGISNSKLSTDFVPDTNNIYNLGSSTAQWNNAYIKSLTINGVACGDILTHNVSEFVDVSSNQTIGGNKTFSGSFSVNKPSPRLQTKSTTYSSETTSAMTIGDIAFLNKDGGFSIWIVNQLRDDLTTRLCFRVYPRNSGTYKGFAFDENCNLYPENTNSALGTSTNKWELFNGVNPGALSLPSGTVAMDLIGDVSVVGTEKKLSKDITVTGFVYADVSFSSTSSNRFNLFNDTKKYGIWIPCDNGRIRQIMPISAGDRLEFNVLDDGSTINAIKLFACQGNV